MKYIPLDALVAEIERRINSANNDVKIGAIESLIISKTLNGFKSFLDTLEVKEVDLEREMQAFAALYLEPLKISDSNIGISITMSQLYSCAKHFFELGLKAQKGE